jgi:preprotein translocase subunit YajC
MVSVEEGDEGKYHLFMMIMIMMFFFGKIKPKRKCAKNEGKFVKTIIEFHDKEVSFSCSKSQ